MSGGRTDVQLHEIAPASDIFEYTTAGVDIPLTEIGGGCRFIQVVTGSGATITVKTVGSNGTLRTLTGLNAGDRLEACQYTLIGSGTTSGIKLRCYR